MVTYYRIYFEDSEGERHDLYIQALSAQNAADFAREVFEANKVIEISKVVNNWR